MTHLNRIIKHIELLELQNSILEHEAAGPDDVELWPLWSLDGFKHESQLIEKQRKRIERLKSVIKDVFDYDYVSLDVDGDLESLSTSEYGDDLTKLGEGYGPWDSESEGGDHSEDESVEYVTRWRKIPRDTSGKFWICEFTGEVPDDFIGDKEKYDTLLQQGVTSQKISDMKMEEYATLLRRGATYRLISLFKLSFSHEHGIIGQADKINFEDFSYLVPGMKMGDVWSFRLGRRIRVGGDIDGFDFIDEWLEDALGGRKYGIWSSDEESEDEADEIESEPGISMFETISLDTGVWVTRPIDPEVTKPEADEAVEKALDLELGSFTFEKLTSDMFPDICQAKPIDPQVTKLDASNPMGSPELVRNLKETNQVQMENQVENEGNGGSSSEESESGRDANGGR